MHYASEPGQWALPPLGIVVLKKDDGSRAADEYQRYG